MPIEEEEEEDFFMSFQKMEDSRKYLFSFFAILYTFLYYLCLETDHLIVMMMVVVMVVVVVVVVAILATKPNCGRKNCRSFAAPARKVVQVRLT